MKKNRYPGINAHLNSLLQSPGSEEQPSLWHTFHTSHIAHIVDFLNQQLPENYAAYAEQSLQTRSLDIGGMITLRRPEPDVSVFQQQPSAAHSVSAASLNPTWQASILEVVEPLRHPAAAVIREISEQGELGKLVSRVELLSPSNKRAGSPYHVNRVEAIQSGVPLIEIDYLHEQPSPINKLPVYPDDDEAYPYYVAVSDPRPDWEAGYVAVFGFRIDEPVTPFPLPLAENESIIFDLNAVYQHTFERGRWANHANYGKTPPRFETYSARDQAYIQSVMKATES